MSCLDTTAEIETINMSSEENPAELLECSKQLPTGPIYRNLQKQVASLSLENSKEMDCILRLIESHTVSLRTRAHLKHCEAGSIGKNNTHLLPGSLVQHGTLQEDSLLDWLSKMPKEWTVVQLDYSYDPSWRVNVKSNLKYCRTPEALHMIRFDCGRKQTPILATIPIPQEAQSLPSEVSSIIEDNQKRMDWNKLTSKQYYLLRDKINLRMKSVVQRLHNDWLGFWVCLLIGQYENQEDEEKVTSFVQKLLKQHTTTNTNILKTDSSLQCLHLLAKASPFLPEWEVLKGIRQFLNVTDDVAKKMAMQMKKENLKSCLARNPVILIPDEELEMFPWEMMASLRDFPICRMPSLHILYALYQIHKTRIRDGKLQVDAGLGYYIVNPQENLPRTEKRLRMFLTARAPSWTGLFGTAPTADQFKKALEEYNIFVYAGHGSGSQFLQGEGIEYARAVTFLFGCSSVTSLEHGGCVEPYGIWHFYLTAGCPMVVGNLWSVTDLAEDAITMHIFHNWLPGTQKMQEEEQLKKAPPNFKSMKNPDEQCQPSGAGWKHEADLLNCLKRDYCARYHYFATSSLVFRGLPVSVTGSVETSAS